MVLTDLQKKLIPYLHPSNIKDHQEVNSVFSNCLLNLIKNHHLDKSVSRELIEIKMIAQMMLSKNRHVISISKGINIVDNKPNSLIIDPTILVQVERNIYETVSLFRLLNCYYEDSEANSIIYKLWIVSGLKYRQRLVKYAKSEENKMKAAQEKQTIESYIIEISSSNLFNNLDDSGKKTIRTAIKSKKYAILFSDNTASLMSWQDLSSKLDWKSNIFDDMYTFFSQYSHPTYVSVFQFAQMFNDQSYLGSIASSLRRINLLNAVFISDFIKLYPNCKKTFNSLQLEDQIIINFYIKIMLGEGRCINDSWKQLG